MATLKRLFVFLLPYWKTLLVSSVLLLSRAGAELVPPLFQKAIVDEVIGASCL
jgi:ABC-type multidrug transport system fused ATPase/permease subunit